LLVLFIFTGSCTNEVIDIEPVNSFIQTVSVDEVNAFFKQNESSPSFFYKSSGEKGYAIPELNKFKHEVIENSHEFMTVIPATTVDNNIDSRILFLKINNKIESVVFSMFSTKEEENQTFTGKIFITNLAGDFLQGFRVEKGETVAELIKNKTTQTARKDITLKGLKMQATANAEEDGCPYIDKSWCELDEVVLTVSSSSTNYINIPYIFNRNTSWGSGYQDTSYDSTPSWDFGSGGGYRPPSGNQIINKLTGKADCVYGKMKSNSLLKKTLKKFNGTTPVDLLINEDDLGSGISGETTYGDHITITLDTEDTKNTPALWVAFTILHESIHADIFRQIRSTSLFHYDRYTKKYTLPSGSRSHFPTLFDYYDDYPDNPQHNYMADYYRKAIEAGLREYAKLIGKTYPDKLYKDIAWAGLHNTNAWDNMYADKVYTKNEQKRIIKAIKKFKKSEKNDCSN